MIHIVCYFICQIPYFLKSSISSEDTKTTTEYKKEKFNVIIKQRLPRSDLLSSSNLCTLHIALYDVRINGS